MSTVRVFLTFECGDVIDFEAMSRAYESTTDHRQLQGGLEQKQSLIHYNFMAVSLVVFTTNRSNILNASRMWLNCEIWRKVCNKLKSQN